MNELEIRSAEPVGMSWPKRMIELVVMPYETEAVVLHRGRPITEICSRGAWDGIERRANRVKVNLEHDVTKPIGRAVAFHPSRREGLVAEVRIAQTETGTETLALADVGALQASAGFMPLDGGETWEAKDYRRLTKCWLGHIAMVGEAAYETADVLAVRHADPGPVSATPFLDEILAERLAKQYGLTP